MSAARFALRGDRAVTHRTFAELTARTGHAIAWARPGAEPLVVLTAAEFARLAGRAIPPTTFAPCRWCTRCQRYRGSRPCSFCNPPTVAARRPR